MKNKCADLISVAALQAGSLCGNSCFSFHQFHSYRPHYSLCELPYPISMFSQLLFLHCYFFISSHLQFIWCKEVYQLQQLDRTFCLRYQKSSNATDLKDRWVGCYGKVKYIIPI